MAQVIYLNNHAEFAQPGFVARLRRRLADHRKYLAIRDELDAHSDRELADLGLSRLSVRDVAREAVHQS